MKAIKCGDPICCSCSCALEFASVYSRESIFQVLVAGGFSKPGIEVAVLWTSSGMATSVIWGLMQVFFLWPVEWEFKDFIYIYIWRGKACPFCQFSSNSRKAFCHLCKLRNDYHC